jgi:diguanylate cyclase (GGDEF)-like protein/PAS domain S-box-containing protein
MTGWDACEAIGHDLGEILNFRDAAGQLTPDESASVAMREDRVIGIDLAKCLQRRDGSPLRVDESAAPVQDERGEHLGAVVVLRDATRRLRFEQLLRESEARFRRAFDFAPVGMALVSLEGRFMQVNAALCRFIGYSADELLTMRHDELTYEHDVEREHHCLLELLTSSSEVAQLEKRYKDRAGKRTLWALANISLLREGDAPVCYLYQIHDLTERKDAEYRLAKLAYDDLLTGLRNRAGLRDDMDHLIIEARRRREQLAVVFLDLDRFKQINDSLGHEAGDDLLRIVARRLRAVLREEDSLARLGGDEFVLVLPELRGMDSVTRVMEKVRAAVSKPIRVLSREVVVTPSIGISLFPVDGNDANSLLRCADSALYLAKAEGRNRAVFFKPELTRQANERLAMESALRKALARHEFYLEYQPIVSLHDNTILGFEALLRWNRAGVVVGPAEFIPVAEDAGLIERIGEWVLGEACRFAASWPVPAIISVNCSARQFREDKFVDIVNATLREHAFAPERLWLELTEGMLLKGDELQLARLRSLRALGVQLAVDDYGVGYSSLSYLKNYAPDGLKIDSMFISDIAHDRNSAAIVRATVAMGHGLGIKVVAEGVETREQAEQLRLLDCDLVQGYLYATPLAAVDVTDVLRRGRLSGGYQG